MTVLKAFLIFMFCICSLLLTAQSQYYVSTTGNDNNSGTSLNQAWQTLQYSLDQLSSNSTLNIVGGTYNEKVYLNRSGTIGQPITITNYNDQKVFIDGSNLPNDDAIIGIFDQSYIHIDGLILSNNSQLDAQGIIVEGNCQGIEIRNNEICNINFSSNPDDITNASWNAQPIIVYGSDASNPVKGLVIENNVVRDSRTGYSEGLAVNGNVDGFTITNNRVYNISNIGIDIIGHENTATSNDQARNGVIKNNVVYNCKSPYATAAGIYVDGGKDLIIESNRVFECQWGIEIGCENLGKTTSNIIVRSNIIYDNDDAGITFGGFDYPSGSGKVIDCQILNNTTFNNDKLLSGIGDTTGEIHISYTENCTFQNNIVFTGDVTPLLLYIDNVNSINLVLDYNMYFGNSNAEFEYQGNTFSSFSAFNSGSGQDVLSTYQNPLFRNPSIDDFHLSSTSPGINNGNPTSSTTYGSEDYDGDIRILDSRIDIGADEFKSCATNLSLMGDLFSNSYSTTQEIQAQGLISNGSIVNLSAPEVILNQTVHVNIGGTLRIANKPCE